MSGTVIVSVRTISDEMPKANHLAQNYPNPFNPSTTFRFAVRIQSRVTVKIIDVLGREIEVLVNEDFQPGNYETSWEAKVPSGIYFYRLEAVAVGDPSKRFVDVKKMVLVK